MGIGLGLSPMGADDGLLVTNDGSRFWSGTRHYYVVRHDGEKPSYFLAHDQLDSNTLSLGSWYGLKMPILVRLPSG